MIGPDATHKLAHDLAAHACRVPARDRPAGGQHPHRICRSVVDPMKPDHGVHKFDDAHGERIVPKVNADERLLRDVQHYDRGGIGALFARRGVPEDDVPMPRKRRCLVGHPAPEGRKHAIGGYEESLCGCQERPTQLLFLRSRVESRLHAIDLDLRNPKAHIVSDRGPDNGRVIQAPDPLLGPKAGLDNGIHEIEELIHAVWGADRQKGAAGRDQAHHQRFVND